MQDRLAIVIPTYNEKQNIKALIFKILEKFPKVRIFVVDDNSPDGTAEIVQELSRYFENVRLIFRQKREGPASAYLDSFARIIMDEANEFILTMDGDFSHRPDDLPKFLDHAAAHDLVIGSRYVSGGEAQNWNLISRLSNKGVNSYARLITGLPIDDLTAGFVLYRRELLARILQNLIKSEGSAYQMEMKYLAYKAGARIKEVPIIFQKRESDNFRFDRRAVWQGIITPWRLRLFR